VRSLNGSQGRAAEQRDELAPTAVDCHVALPWEVMPTQWSDDITLHALAALSLWRVRTLHRLVRRL